MNAALKTTNGEPLTKRRSMQSGVDGMENIYSIDELISIVAVEHQTDTDGNCLYNEDPIPGDPFAIYPSSPTATDVQIIHDSSSEEESERTPLKVEEYSDGCFDIVNGSDVQSSSNSGCGTLGTDKNLVLDPEKAVESLIKHRFISGAWSDVERAKIIIQGLPKVSHTVNSKWESILPVLLNNNLWTLSPQGEAIFCWPCVLFSDHTGIDDPSGMISHTKSHQHLFSLQRLAIWQCKTRSSLPISDLHGDVCEHRILFCRLVDVICLQRGELSLNAISDTLRLVLSMDARLANCSHYGDLRPERMFHLLQHYYEALRSSVILAMRCRLIDEVHQAKMVMLIIENPPDLNDKYCVSVVVRYDFESTVRERFVRFIKIGILRWEMKFFDELLSVVKFLDCSNKLVGFAYDSTIFDPSKIPEFNLKVTQHFQYARFFHYPRHSLKYLVHQSLCMMSAVTEFSHGLTRLTKLFESRDDLRSKLNQYDDFILWDFSHDFVIILANYFPRFMKLFLTIKSELDLWTADTISEAVFFVSFLSDFRNRFLIASFARVLSVTDDLDLCIEGAGSGSDLTVVVEKTIETLETINNITFNSVLIQVFEKCVNDLKLPAGRVHRVKELRQLLQLLLHDVSLTLAERIQSIRHSLDSEMSLIFEMEELSLQTRFMPVGALLPNFSFKNLFMQLKYLKDETSYRDGGFDSLVKTVGELPEGLGFTEFLTLASLVRTMPMKSVDRVSTPAGTRISQYARNKRKSISAEEEFFEIERDLLTEMRARLTFYDDVFVYFFS